MFGLLLKDILPQKTFYKYGLLASIILFPLVSKFMLVPQIPIKLGPIMVLFGVGFMLCIGLFQIDEKEKH